MATADLRRTGLRLSIDLLGARDRGDTGDVKSAPFCLCHSLSARISYLTALQLVLSIGAFLWAQHSEQLGYDWVLTSLLRRYSLDQGPRCISLQFPTQMRAHWNGGTIALFSASGHRGRRPVYQH